MRTTHEIRAQIDSYLADPYYRNLPPGYLHADNAHLIHASIVGKIYALWWVLDEIPKPKKEDPNP